MPLSVPVPVPVLVLVLVPVESERGCEGEAERRCGRGGCGTLTCTLEP